MVCSSPDALTRILNGVADPKSFFRKNAAPEFGHKPDLAACELTESSRHFPLWSDDVDLEKRDVLALINR
jgi:hypothetical protein